MVLHKTRTKASIRQYGRESSKQYTVVWTLQLAVFDAVSNYNYGRTATLDIFEGLNIIQWCLCYNHVQYVK